jgi:hypothetical protein
MSWAPGQRVQLADPQATVERMNNALRNYS